MLRVTVRWRAAVAALVIVPAALACGGGAGEVAAKSTSSANSSAPATAATTDVVSPPAGGGSVVVAALGAIVSAGPAAALTAVQGERASAVGDTVRTDAAGLGELRFPDGSLARIGKNTQLVLVELTAAAVQRTRTSLSVGDTWHQVKDLTASDAVYEVATPVGVAAVRGTTFALSCSPTQCVLTVLEGEVTFTPKSGNPVDVPGPGSLTATAAGPGAPQSIAPQQLQADPWIAANIARGSADATAASTTGASTAASRSAASESESPSASATAAAAPVVDPCTLLTDAEVSKALGDKVTSSVNTAATPGNKQCLWISDAFGPLHYALTFTRTVDMSGGRTAQSEFDLHKRILGKPQPVDGIGDEAVLIPSAATLVARKGEVFIHASTAQGAGAKVLAALTELTRKAVGKL